MTTRHLGSMVTVSITLALAACRGAGDETVASDEAAVLMGAERGLVLHGAPDAAGEVTISVGRYIREQADRPPISSMTARVARGTIEFDLDCWMTGRVDASAARAILTCSKGTLQGGASHSVELRIVEEGGAYRVENARVEYPGQSPFDEHLKAIVGGAGLASFPLGVSRDSQSNRSNPFVSASALGSALRGLVGEALYDPEEFRKRPAVSFTYHFWWTAVSGRVSWGEDSRAADFGLDTAGPTGTVLTPPLPTDALALAVRAAMPQAPNCESPDLAAAITNAISPLDGATTGVTDEIDAGDMPAAAAAAIAKAVEGVSDETSGYGWRTYYAVRVPYCSTEPLAYAVWLNDPGYDFDEPTGCREGYGLGVSAAGEDVHFDTAKQCPRD